MSSYKITINASQNYRVSQGEIALGSTSLCTSGLQSCVGFAVSDSEKVMLSHVDAHGNAGQLAWFLKTHFDPEDPNLDIVVANSGVDDPYTRHARECIQKAVSFAGFSNVKIKFLGAIDGGAFSDFEININGKHKVINKLGFPTSKEMPALAREEPNF